MSLFITHHNDCLLFYDSKINFKIVMKVDMIHRRIKLFSARISTSNHRLLSWLKTLHGYPNAIYENLGTSVHADLMVWGIEILKGIEAAPIYIKFVLTLQLALTANFQCLWWSKHEENFFTSFHSILILTIPSPKIPHLTKVCFNSALSAILNWNSTFLLGKVRPNSFMFTSSWKKKRKKLILTFC